MQQNESFWSSWQERLSALRNVPPVLKIVWQSGPAVVAFGIVARIIAALLPVALGYIPKLIIDILEHSLRTHEPVAQRLWWLVGAEFGLAVLSSIVTRLIDYSDALLANKYTRHVSIEVMKHASALDLTAYEDPVFYDRLERARVQATDRLVMIQSIGRLELQIITAIGWSVAVMIYSPWLMLLGMIARPRATSERTNSGVTKAGNAAPKLSPSASVACALSSIFLRPMFSRSAM